MRKRKPQVYLVNDDLFKFGWMFVFGGSLQSAERRFANRTGIKADEVVCECRDEQVLGHFSAHSPNRNGLLWFKSDDPSMPTVAHECFHAAVYAYSLMDVKQIGRKHDELLAYYLEWLVEQVIAAWKLHQKRIKK